MTAGVPDVTITLTLSWTNSAAISAKRSLRPSTQRYSIATVRPSAEYEGVDPFGSGGACIWDKEPDSWQLVWFLRAHRQMPRNCRAAELRDERAPLHSITSSARRRNHRHRLLRPRRKRPRCSRAAEEREELTSS
jgi:hypothetical protein